MDRQITSKRLRMEFVFLSLLMYRVTIVLLRFVVPFSVTQ